MRVLITGGAGFIGSNLAWALLSGRHEVHVIDDMSHGRLDNLHPAVRTRTLDITDGRIEDVVLDVAPDAIVHLAAQTSVTASLADPDRDWQVNVEGTRLVARAAREAGVRRLIAASSAAVYGEPAEIPLTEEAAKRPINPYGRSKLEAEGVLIEELAGSDVDFASLRFSNVYGPRQDAHGEGGVVAIFSHAMINGRPPVLYGDGSQTRDFIYVGDVASAILAALSHDGRLVQAGPDGPAYNISMGREVSLQELVGSLRLAAGYLGPIETSAPRPGDITRSALDPTKAERTLQWRAGTDLQAGLQMTVQWFARER